MYCKKCGKLISDDSKFCRYCGSEQDTPSVQMEQVIATNNVADKVEEANITISAKPQGKPKRNRLVPLFLWSIAISIMCTIGYAVVRREDSKPWDAEHYWGYSVYDPQSMENTTIESVHEDITRIRKDGYESGIKKMAIYSFPISFGILVLGAIFTGTMNKN